MSMVEQIVYKALNSIKEECEQHEKCAYCMFFNNCVTEIPPAEWDEKQMDEMTSKISEIGWERRK